MYARGSVAGLEARQANLHVLKDNFNVMLPRMLQRRNAVSAESARPGDVEDSKFVVQNFPKSQAQRARIQGILSGIVLFQGVSDSIIKDLVGGFYEVKYNNGDKIIVQGDVIADRFFLLESGQCDIFIQKGSADPVKVHTVVPGGFFGELALLYNAPRAATVISNGESKLWALDRGTFKNCMARASQIEGDAATTLHAATTEKPVVPMFRRGSVVLANEQVMKAADPKSKATTADIPTWNQVIHAKITGVEEFSPRFIEYLLKFSYPDISLYKIAAMDPQNTATLIYPDSEPKKVIFLPPCTLKPTGARNSVELSGPHLDGVVTLKFVDQRDLSKMLDIFKKSTAYFNSAQEAFKEVRYVGVGGKAADIQRPVEWVQPSEICGVGLGLDISQNGKSISVRSIAPGSPAAFCQTVISVHDHLLKVDGLQVKHCCATIDDVVKLIRGVRNTAVKLEFRRSRGPHAKSTYVVILKRGPCVDPDAADVIGPAADGLDSHAVAASMAVTAGDKGESGSSKLKIDSAAIAGGMDEEGSAQLREDAGSVEEEGRGDDGRSQESDLSDSASNHERQFALLKQRLDSNKPTPRGRAEKFLAVLKQTYASTVKQKLSVPFSLLKTDDLVSDVREGLQSLLGNEFSSSEHELASDCSNPKGNRSSISSRAGSESLRSSQSVSSSRANLSRQAGSAASERPSKSYGQIIEAAGVQQAQARIAYGEFLESAVSWSPDGRHKTAPAPQTFFPSIPTPASPSQLSYRAKALANKSTSKAFSTNIGFKLAAADGCHVVHSIEPNAPQSVRQFVSVGDVLSSINREPVASASTDEVLALLRRSNTEANIHLILQRNNTSVHITVKRHEHAAPSSLAPAGVPVAAGFNIVKNDVGSFVASGITSADAAVRRMEVGDVLVSFGAHVFSPNDSLAEAAACFDKTSHLQTKLIVRRSTGTGGSARLMILIRRAVAGPQDSKDPAVMEGTPEAVADVGLELRKQHWTGQGYGPILVTSILPNSRARQCGVSVGDTLLEVDGSIVSADTRIEFVRRSLIGVEGSQISLTLKRADTGRAYSVTLPRVCAVLTFQNDDASDYSGSRGRAAVASTTSLFLPFPSYQLSSARSQYAASTTASFSSSAEHSLPRSGGYLSHLSVSSAEVDRFEENGEEDFDHDSQILEEAEYSQPEPQFDSCKIPRPNLTEMMHELPPPLPLHRQGAAPPAAAAVWASSQPPPFPALHSNVLSIATPANSFPTLPRHQSPYYDLRISSSSEASLEFFDDEATEEISFDNDAHDWEESDDPETAHFKAAEPITRHEAASAPAPLSQSAPAVPPPLPKGWEILQDSSGLLYYGNPSLRIVQHEHPGGAAVAHSPDNCEAASELQDNDLSASTLALPQGWEELRDDDGLIYYGNPSHRIVQLEHPGSVPAPSPGASNHLSSNKPANAKQRGKEQSRAVHSDDRAQPSDTVVRATLHRKKMDFGAAFRKKEPETVGFEGQKKGLSLKQMLFG